MYAEPSSTQVFPLEAGCGCNKRRKKPMKKDLTKKLPKAKIKPRKPKVRVKPIIRSRKKVTK